MSEEQRNQPGDELADAARAHDRTTEAESTAVETTGAPSAEPAAPADAAGESESESAAESESESARRQAERAKAAAKAAEAAGHAKPVVGASAGDAGVTGVTGSTEAEAHDVVGEGSPRYGESPGEIPLPGSEQSWTSGHPGYVADPKLGYTTKRLAAGTLVGCLVLALGVFFSYKLLTAKSSNGFGSAPWTAAVEQGGAVVGGINAQNNGAAPAVVLPASVSFGTGGANAIVGVQRAITACQYATTNTGHLTTSIGVLGPTATLRDWAAQATPSVTSLRTDAEALRLAVAGKDPDSVAAAAENLCTSFVRVASLPSIPDATASQDWSAGVTAYAQAASNALKGVSGDPAALDAAAEDLRQGDVHLETLIVRITEPA